MIAFENLEVFLFQDITDVSDEDLFGMNSQR